MILIILIMSKLKDKVFKYILLIKIINNEIFYLDPILPTPFKIGEAGAAA